MFSTSGLIKLWALERFFASKTSIFNGLLTRLAATAALGIIISVLLGAGLAGALSVGYHEMLLRGVPHSLAISIIAAVTLFLLALLGLAAWLSWRRLGKLSRKLLHRAPFMARFEEVTDAFLKGLMGDEEL